ncbi:MAG: hypothetical protein ACRDPG_07150 [Nocardioidaceae bacterium]
MSRRVSLPGADELFRPTEGDESPPPARQRRDDTSARPDSAQEATAGQEAARQEPAAAGDRSGVARQPSGRVRHDEKITVYVTADELLAIEHTRLRMRSEHGLAVDRGRLVREAIHLVLEDAATNGGDSALVRRLQGQ